MSRSRICLDSSAWMAAFNQDQPKHQVSLNAIVDEFDKGKIAVLVPSVVITEVSASPDPTQAAVIMQFVARSNIEQIDITTQISFAAGQLRRNVLGLGWKLKTLDALIVAAAHHHRADFIISCDRDIVRMNGQLGLSPQIGYPELYFKSNQPLLDDQN